LIIARKADRKSPVEGAENGFTLIELIVVMVLISLLMVFAAPRLQNVSLHDPLRLASSRMISTIRQLKQRAVEQQLRYTLHVNAADDRLWITHAGMSEEEQIAARDMMPVELPGSIDILDVVYPEDPPYEADDYRIFFYAAGYSDPAIIHIAADGEKQRSFVIEPFLSQIALHERYVRYEDA
jgi:prepilin-type N-terminal cleavage/methylation domain-containing protein